MSPKKNKKANKNQDTVLSIVCKNVFTYFNLVFAVIAILLIIVGIMLIGVITVLIIYFVSKKNRRVERLLPQKQNYYY